MRTTVRASELLVSTQSDTGGCRRYTVRTFRFFLFVKNPSKPTTMSIMVNFFHLSFWALTLVVFDDVTSDTCSWSPRIMYVEFHRMQVIFVRRPHGLSIMRNFVYCELFLHVEPAAYLVTRYLLCPRWISVHFSSESSIEISTE